MNEEQYRLIEQLYMELFEKLVIYARCYLQDQALAEEAVQEAFQIACQKPESLQESSNPRGWMKNTVKNVIRNIKHNQATAYRILGQHLQNEKEEAYSEDELSFSTLYGDITKSEEFKLLKEFAVDGRTH